DPFAASRATSRCPNSSPPCADTPTPTPSLSVPPPRVSMDRHPNSTQLGTRSENQTARVERHRPSPRGANYMVLTDIHDMPRQIAEILDHSAADFAVRPRIHTHPHIHRHPAIAGIASRP